MLVSRTCMATDMVLLMMVILLSVMLLVRLMLVLLSHVHLHVPLLTRSPIHHDMLALLVTLIIHAVRIMRGSLRDRRTRR